MKRIPHKKLLSLFDEKVSAIVTALKQQPQEHWRAWYIYGLYFSYYRVAYHWIEQHRYQELADLCQERIESFERCKQMGIVTKPGAMLGDWLQEHPQMYALMHRTEHKAYKEILALLETYTGTKARNAEERRLAYNKARGWVA